MVFLSQIERENSWIRERKSVYMVFHNDEKGKIKLLDFNWDLHKEGTVELPVLVRSTTEDLDATVEPGGLYTPYFASKVYLEGEFTDILQS